MDVSRSVADPDHIGRDPAFECALREGRGGKTKFLDFLFIGAFATKCFESSRIFRNGLPKAILSKGQNTKTGGGGGVRRTPPPPLPIITQRVNSSVTKTIRRIKRPTSWTRGRCGT